MSASEKFDKLFHISAMLLLIGGIRLNTYDFGPKKNYWFDLTYHISSIFYLYFDIAGEIYWIVYGIQIGKSFEELILMVPCITVSMLGTVKSLPMYINRDVARTLIDTLKDIHPELKEIKTKKDEEINTIIKEAETDFSRILRLFFTSASLVFVTFCFLPGAVMAKMYWSGEELEMNFPFNVKYNFDHTQPYVWQLVYIHQVFSTILVICYVNGADTYFYAFCKFIQMHFRILKCEIEHLVDDPWDDAKTSDVYANFTKIVRKHQLLNEMVTKMEQLCAYSSLYNIVTSSFMICLSVFNLTSITDVRLMVSFATFSMMSLFQIFVLCYGGEMIMAASSDVSNGIYNSRWGVVDQRLKKALYIMLARAQRPCKLTAANFADLNLSAFATVLRRSYSYLALLKTVFE